MLVTPTTDAMQVDDALDRLFASGSSVWRRLQQDEPTYVAAYSAYTKASTERDALPADKRCLLQLAIQASLTTLDPRGIEDTMRAALAADATPAEILHVLMLVSFCSVHSLTGGLAAATGGLPADATALDRQEAQCGSDLVEQAHGDSGYWKSYDRVFPGFHERLAQLAPDLFIAYDDLGAALWRPDGLAPVWCELVFVAMDLSSTHLYLDGARLHAANAVHYGATLDQIVAVVALSAAQGARSIEVGAPILWKLLEEANQ